MARALARGLFLIGLFAVTRFLLLFLVDRFGMDASRAAEQSGMLLGGAVLVIALFTPLGASLADKYGHGFTMALGTAMAGVGIAALAFAGSMVYILAGMLLVAFGSGGFLASNTASAANLIPAMHAAKFKGLANLTTLAAAALAGLFGPLLDLGARAGAGKGQLIMFAAVMVTFLIGTLAARPGLVVDRSSERPFRRARGLKTVAKRKSRDTPGCAPAWLQAARSEFYCGCRHPASPIRANGAQ